MLNRAISSLTNIKWVWIHSAPPRTGAPALRPYEKPEISALPLFAGMDEDLREEVFAASFLQVFPPQLDLFEVGQPADFLHVLVDGEVELYSKVGRKESTIRLMRSVSSFILAAVITDMPFLMAARTITSSRIMLVPASLLRTGIVKDPGFMQAVIRELAFDFRSMVRANTDLKLRQSSERLANYLLLESREHGNAGSFRLRCEKRLLASLLGMTPENLSRSCAALARHGTIIHGMEVQISNRAQLEEFASPDRFQDDP